jgi:hypothetical protein
MSPAATQVSCAFRGDMSSSVPQEETITAGKVGGTPPFYDDRDADLAKTL